MTIASLLVVRRCCMCRRVEIEAGQWAAIELPEGTKVSDGFCPEDERTYRAANGLPMKEARS